MLKRIKHILFADGKKPPSQRAGSELELAAAALLVEAATMDGDFDAQERTAIIRLLKARFDLTASEVEALLQDAEAAIGNTNELYCLTRTIKDQLGPAERVGILEMLWEVVYADGVADDFETNLIRRLTGLLYVTDRDSGEARKRVLAKLNL